LKGAKQPTPRRSTSFYSWIEAGKALPVPLAPQLFLAVKQEKVETHQRKRIAQSKGVNDITKMEDEMKRMREEMALLRFDETNRREHLEKENKQLKNQLHRTQRLLQERDTEVATLETSLGTMAHLSLEAVNCKQPSKAYYLVMKEQWC